jgi:hypothetical protein
MEFVEIYAARTRQLSDSIAILGANVAAGTQTGEIMTEIKKPHSLVEQAATDLFAFAWPRGEEPPSE